MPPRLPLRHHLHDNRQHHVLKNPSRRQLLRPISSTAPASEPADTSAEANSAPSTTPYVQDERQTWRIRAYGKRKLPLPPILDPITISQRDRWREPKKPAATPDERTPFQKKLYSNAFAHMLDTPIRQDRKLVINLPTSFLLPLRPLRHPSTDAAWLLPSTNNARQLAPTKEAGSFNVWVLARRAHLRALGNAKKGAWRALIVGDQGTSMGRVNPLHSRDAFWRPDMDEVVLDLLRANVRKVLRYGFGKPRGRGLITRLWDEPGRGFVPYVKVKEKGGDVAAAAGKSMENDEDDAKPSRSLPEQLARHPPPAALLLLRSLNPLSNAPLAAMRKAMETSDGLVNTLVLTKKQILKMFYPNYSPGPHSMWAYVEHVQPHLAPAIRYGTSRPDLVRWTAAAADAGEREAEALPQSPTSAAAADARDVECEDAQAQPQAPRPSEHSRLVPVYSLPDLLGGDDALKALLGQQGDQVWGRGAVLLKAGQGSIGALTALERLRMYVEEPW